MKTEIDVKKYTVEGKPIQFAEKRSKIKIVFHTILGDIRGEVNFSEEEHNMLFESRENYTVYIANSTDMTLQELISKAKVITWKRKAGKIVLSPE